MGANLRIRVEYLPLLYGILERYQARIVCFCISECKMHPAIDAIEQRFAATQ